MLLEADVQMGVVGALRTSLVTQAPVDHRGKVLNGFHDSVVGKAVVGGVVEGELPFARLRHGKHALSYVIQVHTNRTKAGKR